MLKEGHLENKVDRYKNVSPFLLLGSPFCVTDRRKQKCKHKHVGKKKEKNIPIYSSHVVQKNLRSHSKQLDFFLFEN